MKAILLAATSLMLASSAHSAIVYFDILGKDGSGLRSTNENHVVASPTRLGGEVGAGIFFDDITKVLTINVAWGSVNGFTDLTGVATAGHIHGPTAAGGVASFTQNSSTIIGLDSGPTWNNSATSGGITNRTIVLNAAQETALLEEKNYLNFHTGTNPSGEIRGNLVIVPEPSHAVLSIIGLALLGARRKR